MADDWLNDSGSDESDTWGAKADAKRMHKDFMTAGAREGLDAGREATIQAGFDAGFATASRAMQVIQCCRAVLSCVSAEQDTAGLESSLAAGQEALMALPPTQRTEQAAAAAQSAQHDALVQQILTLKQQVMALLPQGSAPLAPAASHAAAAADA